MGFQHNTFNRTYNLFELNTGGIHPNHREVVLQDLLNEEKKHCETNRSFLESYLTEFMWRTRFEEQDAFETIFFLFIIFF